MHTRSFLLIPVGFIVYYHWEFYKGQRALQVSSLLFRNSTWLYSVFSQLLFQIAIGCYSVPIISAIHDNGLSDTTAAHIRAPQAVAPGSVHTRPASGTAVP